MFDVRNKDRIKARFRRKFLKNSTFFWHKGTILGGGFFPGEFGADVRGVEPLNPSKSALGATPCAKFRDQLN